MRSPAFVLDCHGAPDRPYHTLRMSTYTVVPRAGKYWIVKVAEDGSRQTIERFDIEDAAVRRLRVLQEKAGIVDRWGTPQPPRRRH